MVWCSLPNLHEFLVKVAQSVDDQPCFNSISATICLTVWSHCILVLQRHNGQFVLALEVDSLLICNRWTWFEVNSTAIKSMSPSKNPSPPAVATVLAPSFGRRQLQFAVIHVTLWNARPLMIISPSPGLSPFEVSIVILVSSLTHWLVNGQFLKNFVSNFNLRQQLSVDRKCWNMAFWNFLTCLLRCAVPFTTE